MVSNAFGNIYYKMFGHITLPLPCSEDSPDRVALKDTGPSCLASDFPYCYVGRSPRFDFAAAGPCSGSSAVDLASQFGNLKQQKELIKKTQKKQ